MELHCQLDAESVRKLALRLYGEQALKADPAGVVFATVNWIDRVLSNEEGHESSRPLDTEIQQLADVVRTKGVSAVATELKVSVGALKSWVSGFYSPTRSNLEKVRKYLQEHEALPPGEVEASKAGALFTQQQPGRQQEPHPESSQL